LIDTIRCRSGGAVVALRGWQRRWRLAFGILAAAIAMPSTGAETVYVWVARFKDSEAYAAYQKRLEADRRWSHTLWPAARDQLSREPEVLRLTPTPRSRLRG
jgi:hypothetical protein